MKDLPSVNDNVAVIEGAYPQTARSPVGSMTMRRERHLRVDRNRGELPGNGKQSIAGPHSGLAMLSVTRGSRPPDS